MTGVGDDSRGRLLGRPWFVVGLALALAATLALVLANDIRFLRLGIVAALWAALVGAFLAVKYRKHATSTEEAVAQAQEVYELELEREIAARREYELEIEAETRSRSQADSRGELDALRAEVVALRDSLQSLFGGGEVLLERVALTAQATRMRALREEQRVVETNDGGRPHAQLTAAPGKEMADRPTELIERIREKQPARPVSGRPSAAPEPRRPERSLDLPPRRVAKSEPAAQRQARGNNAAASVAKAAAEARAEQTRVQHPQKPAAPKQEEPRRPPSIEMTRPAFSPSERRRVKPEPPKPDPDEQPTQLAKAIDADWTPSWETGQHPAVTDVDPFSAPNGNGNTAPRTPEPQPQPQSQLQPPAPVTRLHATPPEPPQRPAPAPAPMPAPVPPREEELPAASNPTLPEEARRLAQEGRPGGRRRRAEDEAPAAEPVSGGRRRRPEGEPPSWQAQSGSRSTGSHAKPDTGANGRAAQPGGRRAAPEETNTGSHSAGRSVSDLLAANGATTDAIPRRRRRADD
jgi:hypothetical protein